MPSTGSRRSLPWAVLAPLVVLAIAGCSGAGSGSPADDDEPAPTESLEWAGDYDLAYSDAALVGTTGLDGLELVFADGYLGFSWTPTAVGSSGLTTQLATRLTILCLGEAPCTTSPGAGELLLDGAAPAWDPYIVSTIGGLLDGCPPELLLEPQPVRDIVEDDGEVASFAATVGVLVNNTWSEGSPGCAAAASATVEMTATRVG